MYRPVVVVGVPLWTTVVIIISELWVGCNAFNSLHLLGSITHSASGESPIVTFDSLLPFSVLVFSSFNVYKMGFRSLLILNIKYTTVTEGAQA